MEKENDSLPDENLRSFSNNKSINLWTDAEMGILWSIF